MKTRLIQVCHARKNKRDSQTRDDNRTMLLYFAYHIPLTGYRRLPFGEIA